MKTVSKLSNGKLALMLTISLIICKTVYGQSNSTKSVLVDRFCNCPEFRWDGDNYVLNDIKHSANDIEIRITTLEPDRQQFITVLTKKNEKVEGWYYHKKHRFVAYPDSIKKYGKWEMYPYRKFRIQGANLDSVISELFFHKITALPNLKDVYKGGYLANRTVEYKINSHFGKYTFGRIVQAVPESELKPLREYNNISQIFERLTASYAKAFHEMRYNENLK